MAEHRPQPVPILVYHQIAPAPAKGSAFRSLCVAPGAFARQMALLKLLGYSGLSMTQLQPYLTGQCAGKVVGITFDDGYLNNLTHALPVLKKHGFSSTCYAVSGLLGQTNLWDAPLGVAQTLLMNASELVAWQAGGQEVASHTKDHVDLQTTSDVDSAWQISASKSELEAVLGRSAQHFCYPYGSYQSKHVDMVAAQGFVTATTTRRGRCDPASLDLLQLPRVPVVRSTTLLVFWLKVATGYEDRHSA